MDTVLNAIMDPARRDKLFKESGNFMQGKSLVEVRSGGYCNISTVGDIKTVKLHFERFYTFYIVNTIYSCVATKFTSVFKSSTTRLSCKSGIFAGVILFNF